MEMFFPALALRRVCISMIIFHGSGAKVVVETLDQRMLEVVPLLLEVHVRSFVLFVFSLG